MAEKLGRLSLEKCHDCSGMGTVPSYVEKFLGLMVCPTCKGIGWMVLVPRGKNEPSNSTKKT